MSNLLKTKRMKKLILMSLMAVFCLSTVSAQKTVVSKKNQKVFDVVEQMPEFPGGMEALFKYMAENMKYPEDAKKQQVEGRVLVQFIVETDGSVSNTEVLMRVFPSLDAEAVRVISGMPKWIPGKQNGKVVRVKYTIPVSFRFK